MFLEGRLDADDIIDDTGLVPAAVMDAGFQSIKPTDQLVQPLNLWRPAVERRERPRTSSRVTAGRATRSPFPGALFRQTVDTLVRDNALASGEVPFAGGERAAERHQAPVPQHLLRAGHDRARRRPRSRSSGLVGSRDATELRLETGHVGLVAGRYAEEVARPAIADWIRRHSANRKTATAKEKTVTAIPLAPLPPDIAEHVE